jgi:hypothetical protein
MAKASRNNREGQRFDSVILHNKSTKYNVLSIKTKVKKQKKKRFFLTNNDK